MQHLKMFEIKKIELVEKESYKAILSENIKLPISKNGYAELKKVLEN